LKIITTLQMMEVLQQIMESFAWQDLGCQNLELQSLVVDNQEFFSDKRDVD